MKLSFSTLACPAWTTDQAIKAARSYGYDGIEWRLVNGEILNSSFPIDAAKRLADEVRSAGLEVSAADTGVRDVHLIAAPGAERDGVVAEARAMLRIAGLLGAEHLRVFPGDRPKGVSVAEGAQWARETLHALLPDAEENGVNLALELHNATSPDSDTSTTSSQMAALILAAIPSQRVGIQWDLGNTYLEGEDPAQTWSTIKSRLLYFHTKDLAPQPDGEPRYVEIGTGAVPITDILKWLTDDGFDGWLSYEWEKKWHPELAEPEVALPQYVEFMRRHIG